MLAFPRSQQKYPNFDECPIEKLMTQKPDKDEIIRNTLRSVVNLQHVGKGSPNAVKSEQTGKVIWDEELFAHRYYREDVPCNIQPTRERRKLRNIVKGDKKKTKKQ